MRFVRFKLIALLLFSMVSASYAQMGPLWDLNNKVDDLKFQLEMQKLERMDRGFVGTKVFEWPANPKHLLNDERGSHYVDPRSVAGDKQHKQANFYVDLPKVKTNKNGTYKAIGIFTVISCDMGTYTEIGVATYKPDYTVGKIFDGTLDTKYVGQQSPAEKKYMHYVCGK